MDLRKDGYTIMVVDDEAANLRLVSECLKGLVGRILVARDGESALKRACYAQPDLILLDVMMPGIDGFEVCRQLKASQVLQDIPVIFLTSLAEIGDKMKGFQAGAVDYILKPFQIEEVLARVEAHLASRATQQQLEVQNVQLQTDRKWTREQLQCQLKRLRILHDIDRVIGSSLDLRFTLNAFLKQVTQQLYLDAADILLYEPFTQTLDFAAGTGFQTNALQHIHLRLNQGYAGKAIMEMCTVAVPDLLENPGTFFHSQSLVEENFVSYIGIPLVVKGQIRGILEIFHREKLDPAPEYLHFLETMAAQAAIAIDNAILFENLQKSNLELTLAYETTLEGWARALELRDKETEGHSQNVTKTTLKLAKTLGIRDSQLEHIRRGALLHDIGKMGVSDEILRKPGPLTEGDGRSCASILSTPSKCSLPSSSCDQLWISPISITKSGMALAIHMG